MKIRLRARFEKGVLKPLEPVRLREGAVVEVIVEETENEKLRAIEETFGLAKRIRPSLTREDVWRVIEEIEDEDMP